MHWAAGQEVDVIWIQVLLIPVWQPNYGTTLASFTWNILCLSLMNVFRARAACPVGLAFSPTWDIFLLHHPITGGSSQTCASSFAGQELRRGEARKGIAFLCARQDTLSPLPFHLFSCPILPTLPAYLCSKTESSTGMDYCWHFGWQIWNGCQ